MSFHTQKPMNTSVHIKLNLISSIALLMFSIFWPNFISSPRIPGPGQSSFLLISFIQYVNSCCHLFLYFPYYVLHLYARTCLFLKVSAHVPSISSIEQSLDDTSLLFSSLAPRSSSPRNWEKDDIFL